MDKQSLLTKQEWEAYDFLSQAWGVFIKLQTYHVEDNREFAQAINTAKNIIMSRAVSRELIDVFKDEDTGYIKPNELLQD